MSSIRIQINITTHELTNKQTNERTNIQTNEYTCTLQ